MREIDRDPETRRVDDARSLRYRLDVAVVAATLALVTINATLRLVVAEQTRRVAVVRLAAAALLFVGEARREVARRAIDGAVGAELALAEPTLALGALALARVALAAALERTRYDVRVELALTTVSLGAALVSTRAPIVARASALVAALTLGWLTGGDEERLVVAALRYALVYASHFALMWRVADGQWRARDSTALDAAALADEHVGALGWLVGAYPPLLLVGAPLVLVSMWRRR